jgi:predicted dehydrogenase
MVTPAPLRLGVLGAGAIFRRYEQAVDRAPDLAMDLEIVAVADPDPRAREAAARPGRKVFTTARELLAEPLDAVLILTPNASHPALVSAALERGLDVLCEKPLATSAAAARSLCALAARTGRLLYTAMHCRHRPEVRYLADHLDGEVVEFRQVYREDWRSAPAWYYQPAVCGGGVLLDVGINQLDWILPFVAPLSVAAAALTLDEQGVDVECAVTWSSGPGRSSTELSWRAFPEDRRTEIRTAGGARFTLDHTVHCAWQDGRLRGPWRNDEYGSVLRDFAIQVRDPAARAPSDAPRLLELLREVYAYAGLDFLA